MTTSVSVAVGGFTRITYGDEATWGTTPASLKVLRTRGSSLELTRGQLESKELRSDRQISDFRLGAHEAVGDIECEVIPGAMDDLLSCACMGEWQTNTLKAGTTFKSLSIEVGETVLGIYQLYTGMVVDKVSVSVKPNDIATMRFTFKGKTAAVSGVSVDGTPDAAVTTAPCDAFTGSITEGGSSIAVVTGIDFTLDNQVQSVPVVGSVYPYAVVPGRAKLTGTLTAVFASSALLAKFIAETASSLVFVLKGIPDTKTYTFTIPNVKYTGGKWDINSEQDLVLTMPFVGLYDSGTASNLKIDRAV